MATKKIFNDLDLQKGKLKNSALESLGSNPSAPVTGQMFFDTNDNKPKIYNGTSFVEFGGGIEEVQAGSSKVSITNGTGPTVTIDVVVANLINDSGSGSGDIWSASKIASEISAAQQGLHVKDSVRVATTTTLPACTYDNGTSGVGATLTGDANGALASIDGVTLTTNNRLLVKDEADASTNGIFVVTQVGDVSNPFILTRSTDFDDVNSIKNNSFMFVQQGTTNFDSGWVLTTDGTITVGTTDLNFTQFSGAGQITAGDGLSKSGNTLSVNVDDSTTEISGDAVIVKDLGITNAKLAGSIADSKLNQITTTNKVAGSAIQIATGAALSDATGLKVNVDDSSIEVNSGNLRVKALGITSAMLAGSIADSKLSTITTANKVSGSAVQLASGSAILDNTGLDVRIDDVTIGKNGSNALEVKNSSITYAKLANQYIATFVDTDFSSGVLTISAGTHGLGASGNLAVRVYLDNGTDNDDVTSGVLINVADAGDVTITVNNGLQFDGKVIITRW